MKEMRREFARLRRAVDKDRMVSLECEMIKYSYTKSMETRYLVYIGASNESPSNSYSSVAKSAKLAVDKALKQYQEREL